MFWKLLADLTLAFHAAWVAAFLLGPIWAWTSRPRRYVHLAVLWSTLLVELSGYYCPLTLLETSLRVHYDPSRVYAEGFVAHWINRCLSVPVNAAWITAAVVGWAVLWTVLYGVLRPRSDTLRM